MLPYILLFLSATLVSAFSQVLLKKAALQPRKNLVMEYLNPRVIIAYALFFGATLLTTLAYRGIPMSLGAVLDTTGYVYVTIFGVTVFHEKLTGKKLLALAMILGGILVYTLLG